MGVLFLWAAFQSAVLQLFCIGGSGVTRWEPFGLGVPGWG
jgi:hypothetical protein